MDEIQRAKEIADEQAFEKIYILELNKRADGFASNALGIAPNTFTASIRNPFPRHASLIGRIELNEADEEDLGGMNDFYIGEVSHLRGDARVIGWASRVAACVFYRKPSDRHVTWCDEVAVVRTFIRRGGKISDFEDEVFTQLGAEPLFSRRTIQIPRAPSVTRPAVRSEPDDGVDKFGNSQSNRQGGTKEPESGVRPTSGTAPKVDADPFAGLRSKNLLVRACAEPKKPSMSAVLATLQPDQYDFVTRPASENLILQGHPGTGKTVIATHRVAFLLHPEYQKAFDESTDTTFNKQPESVLVVGPTSEWVAHVQGALRELIEDERLYRVVSLPDLENQLSGVSTWNVNANETALAEVSQDLAELIEIALARAKKVASNTQRLPSQEVYQQLLSLVSNPPSTGIYRDLANYIRQLPPTLAKLISARDVAHRPLLAYLRLRTGETNEFARYGHIILDEAQDIYPIQWETLGRIGIQGGWTIVGDLNQRRTDHTYGSWGIVSELLGLENKESESPLHVLKIGYRSTSQIIRFADQLLPKAERHIQSVQQNGVKPRVIREAQVASVATTVILEAEKLFSQIQVGTVAVISVNTSVFSRVLVKAGWKKNATRNSWENASWNLYLLNPDQARGLEFDGVVVVEPADFPENLGRAGVLYTSLTRANKLLTVVHHRALPRGMKREL